MTENTKELRDSCGVFGIVAAGEWPTKLEVTELIYLGLIAIQHRGQESSGMVTSYGEKDNMKIHRRPGLANQAYTNADLIKLNGNLGIGHNRYSTQGGTNPLNIQPFVVHMKHAQLALAHNGQLVNAAELRREVYIFDILWVKASASTQSDSELMIQMLCQPPPEPNNETEDKPDWPARIKFLMTKTKLAYSLVIMSEDRIYAVRDPFGLRPLCLGKIKLTKNSVVSGEQDDKCAAYVVASESCAFWSIGADYFRDVEPGEIVEITKEGIQTAHVVPRSPNQTSRLCVLEYVYFARPDSILGGQMVYTARMECGRQLAKQAPVEADVVTGVPESAIAAAFGFAEESGIPYTEVFSKNRYVGRTFIQPTKTLRQLAVRKKFGPLTDNFKGKRIALIDDSIVRGTTIASIIRLLKEAGASEVHIRIASPPLHNPCNMGINIPTKEELIANTSNAEQLAKKLGADSLVYLTVENLTKSVTMHSKRDRKVYGHCTACFTGEYPAELEW